MTLLKIDRSLKKVVFGSKNLIKNSYKMSKITKSYVEKISFTAQGQKFYPCDETKGFGVLVGQKSKTFCAQRDIGGRTVRVTIGRYGIFTVEQAREEAKEHLRNMSKGINPNKEKKKAQQRTTTLKEAINTYREGRKDLSKSSLGRLTRIESMYLPNWMNVELKEITKDMALKQHVRIGTEHGKTTANNVFQAIRAVYNFARNRDDTLPENPITVLSRTRSWYKENKRRGMIKPHQLPVWYATVMLLDNNTIRDYLRLLLFTGMRREEGLTLAWDNVDFEDRTLLIPHTKNGNPLELPMSDYIYDLLMERRARNRDKSRYVFPSKTSKHGHLIEPRKTMDMVIESSGIEFMLHDLRRTFITIAESIDIPAYALKALINHSTGGDVTSGYIQITVDRLREPMQRVADKIIEMTNAVK